MVKEGNNNIKLKRINIFTNEIRLYSYTYRNIFYLLDERAQNTASLADEGNYAYCQSSGAHNIKHI